jgi:hypothetical protein
VIGAALAAVAARCSCSITASSTSTSASTPGIKAFTAAVLGGIGSLPGAMLGGLLIGLIETFWSAYFSVEYKDVAAFSILAIVLIFLPTGLLGRARSREGLMAQRARPSRPPSGRMASPNSKSPRRRCRTPPFTAVVAVIALCPLRPAGRLSRPTSDSPTGSASHRAGATSPMVVALVFVGRLGLFADLAPATESLARCRSEREDDRHRAARRQPRPGSRGLRRHPRRIVAAARHRKLPYMPALPYRSSAAPARSAGHHPIWFIDRAATSSASWC